MKDLKLVILFVVSTVSTLYKLLATVYGWVLLAVGAVINYLAPEKMCFILVLAGILIDAFFGICVSVKLGRFVLSKLGRVTLFKCSAYGAALAFAFMIESLAHDSGFLGVKVVAGIALACEFWSTSASVLIVWPEAAFFRLMRRYLKGEIEAKLGKPIDDILTEGAPLVNGTGFDTTNNVTKN